MIYIALFFLLSLTCIIAVPIAALAEVHEIKTEPLQRCGPMCVIETVGFDDRKEAEKFWEHYHDTIQGPGGHGPYLISGSDLWFVDYQVTESV